MRAASNTWKRPWSRSPNTLKCWRLTWRCSRLLESVHTVLTQPGTPVSFQGMFIYSLFDFWKLQIFRCFPFPENSGLRRFPRFLYYVITLILCLHLSLVTPSAVGVIALFFTLIFHPFSQPCHPYNRSPFLLLSCYLCFPLCLCVIDLLFDLRLS